MGYPGDVGKRAFVLLAAAVAKGACSTYTAEAPPPASDAGTTPVAEAGADDASVTDAASDATAAACDLSSLPGRFYSAQMDGDCGGWGVVNGSIAVVSVPARCGAGSCRVCSNGAGTMDATRAVPVAYANGTLEARAALRGESTTSGWTIQASARDGAGAVVADGQNSGAFVVGKWIDVQQVLNVSGAFATAHVSIRTTTTGADECFFIDEPAIGHY